MSKRHRRRLRLVCIFRPRGVAPNAIGYDLDMHMGEGPAPAGVRTSGSIPMDHTMDTVSTVGPRGNQSTGGDSRRSGQCVTGSPNKALVSDRQRDPLRRVEVALVRVNGEYAQRPDEEATNGNEA